MRLPCTMVVFIVLVLATVSQAEVKPASHVPPNAPRPRQGGDTIASAVLVDHLPLTTTGTTTGFTDDYDEVCPYTGSTSPDVVYAYAPGDMPIPCLYADIDLYGSLYDTKVYVYDSQGTLVACNDDYHPDYTSRIDMIGFFEAETYYIVVDGYGGDHGEYTLQSYQYSMPFFTCPPDSWDEGEPPLQDGVPDTYNSGCDGNPVDPANLPLPADTDGVIDLCGSMGWRAIDGEPRRDYDWFSLVIGASGTVEGEFLGNLGATIQVVSPGGCDGLEIQQTIEAAPFMGIPLTITGPAGSEVWLRLTAVEAEPPCGGYTPQEWPYSFNLTGLQAAVPVRTRSWSEVKALFHR